tara:strand:- start:699 stop:1229 length:531 start_codon:yes stop_codon:yes gene_type:complete
MHIKNYKKYYFLNKFDYSHLINLDQNISFIWRNKDKQTTLKNLIELRLFCKKYRRKLYISNDIRLAVKLNVDGLYISSTNKSLTFKPVTFKKKFEILGSAHNFKEIRIKELQGVNKIFLSPIFKNKKNQKLGLYKYLNLKKLTLMKDIALGGINKENIKKLKLVEPYGFAGISYFK